MATVQPNPDGPGPVPPPTDEGQSGGIKQHDQAGDAIHPMIARSRAAFLRALPELLKQRPRQWVAYHGDDLIGFNRSKTALYQECLRRGLRRGEFLVESIEPEVPREAELPSDV
jgi:hypothetical protein